MRYGIISDIHSNLEALNAVLDRIGQVDAYICLGDIVGYGANPNECCDIIRGLAADSVIGNHDAAALGTLDVSWFNRHARYAVARTSELLSDESRSYLAGMSFTSQTDKYVLAHGSLDNPPDFRYIDDPWMAQPSFKLMPRDMSACFVGHTHLAEQYVQQWGVRGADRISMSAGGRIQLREGFRYIINCGSVGQPRDGNPAAACGVFDTDAGTVEILRVDYDIAAAQKKIRDAGFPLALADRLALGF